MSLDAVWPSAPVVLGAKGRLVLPVAVRRAARIDEGTELIARHVSDGQILLETRDAVRSRVWDAAPEPHELDTSADVRELRSDDARQAAARQTRSAAATPDLVGAALLERLGL